MLPTSLHSSIVYGPVLSRRLGRSLGLNVGPLGVKTCNYNCVYCQYGWTTAMPARDARWPEPDRIAASLEARLQAAAGGGERIDRITIAGDGEPTLHPRLAGVVGAVRAVRDRAAPATPIAILTNASTLGQPAVLDALRRVDERYVKLDAGDAVLLRRLNGAAADLAAVVAGVRALDGAIVQSMFVTDGVGRLDNTTDAAVRQWLAAIVEARPRAVQVYTLDRAAAWPYLKPVGRDRLDTIASHVRYFGMPAEVYPSRMRA